MTTPRNEAGGLVMSKPSKPADPQQLLREVTQGNLLLMESTFLELVSNIRALDRSNGELEEALIEDPGDVDFLLAVKENKYIILRKREELLRLVVDMKRMGADMDVPDDIRDMKLDMTPKQETDDVAPPSEEQEEEAEAGVYL